MEAEARHPASKEFNAAHPKSVPSTYHPPAQVPHEKSSGKHVQDKAGMRVHQPK